MWPINQFPGYIPNYPLIFNIKVEPINKKEHIKSYKESEINKYLGTKVDIYV